MQNPGSDAGFFVSLEKSSFLANIARLPVA
jgi:hypothetical protein